MILILIEMTENWSVALNIVQIIIILMWNFRLKPTLLVKILLLQSIYWHYRVWIILLFPKDDFLYLVLHFSNALILMGLKVGFSKHWLVTAIKLIFILIFCINMILFYFKLFVLILNLNCAYDIIFLIR
jgi:hypothetical protein